MNAPTPFSGLSVVIHLLIIGIATLAQSIIKKTGLAFATPVRVAKFWKSKSSMILPVISIFIILLIALWVVFTTTVALKTSIHESNQESNAEFIQNRYTNLKELSANITKWNIFLAVDN